MATVDVFYREGLQALPQLTMSAMGRDTGILEGKNPGCLKRNKGGKDQERQQGGIELWELEGTHSSLGRNPPTTT